MALDPLVVAESWQRPSSICACWRYGGMFILHRSGEQRLSCQELLLSWAQVPWLENSMADTAVPCRG